MSATAPEGPTIPSQPSQHGAGTRDDAPDRRSPTSSVREHLLQVLRLLQDQARSADAKAGPIVAVTSALVGWMLLTGKALGPHALAWPNVLFHVALAAGAISDFLAILVIVPRPWSPHLPGSFFFGDIVQHADAAAFWQHLNGQSEEDLARQLSDEVYVMARIVHRKFTSVTWASWLAVSGGALAAVASVAARV